MTLRRKTWQDAIDYLVTQTSFEKENVEKAAELLKEYMGQNEFVNLVMVLNNSGLNFDAAVENLNEMHNDTKGEIS